MSGGERYMLSLATCLADEHSVSVFWDPENEAEIRKEAERKFGMNLDAVKFTPSIFNPDTSLMKRLRKSKEYDLIIVLSDGSIPSLGCRTIIHFQTPVEWVKGKSLLNRIKFTNVSQVICNSKYTKKYIDRNFGVTSTVLYPPVDLPEKTDRKKEQIILNLGRFGIRAAGSSFKKQEALRDVFLKMSHKERGDWKLVFIVNSTENEKDALDAFVDSVKDTDIAVVVNPDMKTVKDYYGKAGIYWHAAGFGEDLVKHPDRAEHFGLSTVEAMHYGAVPVVIDAGGQPEIVIDGENGFLWKTEDELIEKTQQLIKDTDLRKKLSEAAEERAAFFAKDRFCQELNTLLS
jgi:glycosyltransferase involved in cell wall biosynthesis